MTFSLNYALIFCSSYNFNINYVQSLIKMPRIFFCFQPTHLPKLKTLKTKANPILVPFSHQVVIFITAGDPFLHPFLQGPFLHRFCLSEKAKQGPSRILAEKLFFFGSFFYHGEKYLLIFVCIFFMFFLLAKP